MDTSNSYLLPGCVGQYRCGGRDGMGRWPQWNTRWCPPANLSDVVLVAPGLKGVSFGSIVRLMIGGAYTVGPAKTKDMIGEANLSTIFICGNRIGHCLSMVAGLAQSNVTILVFLEGHIIFVVGDVRTWRCAWCPRGGRRRGSGWCSW